MIIVVVSWFKNLHTFHSFERLDLSPFETPKTIKISKIN